MENEVDIEKLALLARIKLNSQDKENLQKEFGAVLEYISRLKDVETNDVEIIGERLENIMREDNKAHEPGQFSEDLLKATPAYQTDSSAIEHGYVEVKHIL